MSKLPVIVGFGGFNAAGRSSGHQAYCRMILESLDVGARQKTLSGLANMMGLDNACAEQVEQGTLIRKIEPSYFDADNTPLAKRYMLPGSAAKPVEFEVSRRQLPTRIPGNWQVQPLDEEGRNYKVSILDNQEVKIDTYESIAVKAAGQLPSGFDPAAQYRSKNHPRGLQMAVLGASDAVKSMGIQWQDITSRISPDQISVYSSSLMSQLDNNGFGGLFNGRSGGSRATSKQVALGLNTMPADFINAYVLGSMGSTGGVTGACATFLYNLRQGAEDIRSGRRLVSLVGASEAPIIPEIIDGYGAMGALASDADLQKLDASEVTDHRRASRPFGENCGFTLAESSQYVMLMSDELALELGAKVYGAVPAVYVNADGYKRSISAPGAGNYITMAKSLGLVRTLLGEEALQNRTLVQAHGSSTPQNRVTESKIFDAVAKAFNIHSWPVGAVKSYLGHSLAAASGDQLAATLGIFEHDILPGIKTLSHVASDIFDERLTIPTQDLALDRAQTDAVFLNSKGFGGNNATATIFSPDVVKRYWQKRHDKSTMAKYQNKLEKTEINIGDYLTFADKGQFDPIYEFGNKLVDEDKIEVNTNRIQIPGYECAISLENDEGFANF